MILNFGDDEDMASVAFLQKLRRYEGEEKRSGREEGKRRGGKGGWGVGWGALGQ